MRIDLMMGGYYDIESVNDIKTSYYNETKTGIVLVLISGLKITIKCNDTNIKKWMNNG